MNGDTKISLILAALLSLFTRAWCTEGGMTDDEYTSQLLHFNTSADKTEMECEGSSKSHSVSLLWIPTGSPRLLFLLQGRPSLLWLTLYVNHCLHSHQQPRISLKGLYVLALSRLPSSVGNMWGAWEQRGNQMTTYTVFVLGVFFCFELEIKTVLCNALGNRIRGKYY